jgi:hypothetical protein
MTIVIGLVGLLLLYAPIALFVVRTVRFAD